MGTLHKTVPRQQLNNNHNHNQNNYLKRVSDPTKLSPPFPRQHSTTTGRERRCSKEQTLHHTHKKRTHQQKERERKRCFLLREKYSREAEVGKRMRRETKKKKKQVHIQRGVHARAKKKKNQRASNNNNQKKAKKGKKSKKKTNNKKHDYLDHDRDVLERATRGKNTPDRNDSAS